MNNNMYSRPQRVAPSLSIPEISSRSPGSIDLSMETMDMDPKPRLPATPAGRSSNPMPWGLLSFYGNSEAPWAPLFATGTESQQGAHVTPSEVQLQRKANPAAFSGWRSNLPSECGTVPHGHYSHSQCLPSDSGYESRKPDDTSVYGDERNYDTQSLSESLIGHQFFGQPGPVDAFSRDPRESWNQAPTPTPVPASQNGTVENRLICPDCQAPCKTKSELNKHNQRHRKAWKCEVPGCTRKEGFGTQNDLDRHRNSVHPDQFSAGPRYRCNIGPCVTKDKIWPRADNFRQHLKRVHHNHVQADEDLSEFALPTAQKPEEHVRQNVQEDLEGVGSDLFPTGSFNPGPTMPWEGISLGDDVQLSPPEQEDMEVDLLVDPSLSTNVLDASPMDIAPKGQVPEQGSNQDLKNHSQPSYGSIQSQFVQPGEISRPASARTITVGRTEARPNGPRAIQSQSSVPDNNQASQDSAIDMKYDSPPKDPSAPESSDPIARNQSGKMVSQDQATDQSPSASCSSEELNEQDMLKFLSKMPKALIESFLNGNSAENAEQKSSPASNSNTETGHLCPHPGCGKLFHRRCELKKHQKRHDKPYGCTFANCTKKFGSKNDWKRHENSQHFQLEVWKCTEKRAADDNDGTTTGTNNNGHQDGTCGKVCHRRETYRSHLQKEHRMTDAAQIDRALEMCRVGRNCDSRFWCGFCVRVIEITKKGTGAWTERFNHIDNHYTGKENAVKMDCSQWKHVDPELPEVDLNGSPDDSSDDSSDEAAAAAASRQTSGSGVFVSNTQSRKRAAEDSADDEPDAKRVGTPTRRWLCCKCTMDADIKLHDGCVCGHMRCNCCEQYTTWVSADKHHTARPSKTQTVEATV